MPKESTRESPNDSSSLKGTTLKVYRYVFKSGEPVRIGDIHRDLALSSASVAQYHVAKLLQLGLIREEPNGYVTDKVVFDNIIRFRRLAIPVQTAYAAFFLTSLFIMLTFLRPDSISSIFVFATGVISVAAIISAYEAIKALRIFR